ncbi:MAG: hypothetical protein GTN38_03600 [Candidatus Aenigmarchaeota archaeon]|nr:hypothetical protein [Candidatus Aenigmarchaeota archaeon]NIP40746.1 hypothetical protein [Candidatus Aenigmarchaeota archaeon]NIQ18552.1 hypothetical protein [Candidatus Aenigmarchaeota archaeon]NIS73451.1 hypothetical protein [Candidatus Aenigmarchaeota archaeon]
MTKHIHWWEFPLDLTSIKLEKNFKEKFFKKSEEYFSTTGKIALFLQKKSKLYSKNITSDYRIVWYYKKKAEYIPAWVIYEIAKKINFKLSEIEKYIKSYVSTYGRLYGYKPKLPVIVTPEFISIAIHMMCDGSVAKKNFFYYQKGKIGLERFKRLIQNVFGGYEIKEYKRGCYIPALFSEVITRYLNVDTYLSAKCRIPKKIMNGDKQVKIATLLAVLHDDGNVSGRVRLLSSNRNFAYDLKSIMESLNYQCTVSIFKRKGKMKGDHYALYLSANSLKKFAKDCEELIIKFSDMHIGRKLNEIKNIIRINNRKWKQRRKFKTKDIILESLTRGPKTVYELREIVNINLWTTYHHLQQLMRKNRVKKFKSGKSYKYTLTRQL